MSAGDLDDRGIVPNSGFQRYSARLKADYQVKPCKNERQCIVHPLRQLGTGHRKVVLLMPAPFARANIMGAIYPMYVRDAEGNIMVDNRGSQQ